MKSTRYRRPLVRHSFLLWCDTLPLSMDKSGVGIRKIAVYAIAIFAQSAIAAVSLSKSIFREVPFSSQYSEDGALIRSVDFRSVNDLLPQIEKKFKKVLKGASLSDRNEAHITVVTPPEAKTDFFPGNKGIDKFYPTSEMISDYKAQIQDTRFKVVCVGMQKNDKGNVVFYLVVESENILDIRKDIEKLVEDRGGKESEFKATKGYFPHITIGFIGGDVHGVSKGKETCVEDVVLI